MFFLITLKRALSMIHDQMKQSKGLAFIDWWIEGSTLNYCITFRGNKYLYKQPLDIQQNLKDQIHVELTSMMNSSNEVLGYYDPKQESMQELVLKTISSLEPKNKQNILMDEVSFNAN